VPADGDLSMEDLIPDEDVVVTITRGGYAKRTRTDQYRVQKRGGKGVRGATLRGDDVVEHLFVTTAHHWILFFTDQGRVYRTKAYHLPEVARDAKGGHVAGLLSFQPDEQIAEVLTIRDYEQAPFLVLATRKGMVKKTRLGEYDSPRQAGLIALNFRTDDDTLIGADLVSPDDEVLLVSRRGQALRFVAADGVIRPMGRATSGVTGMRFRGDDEVLAMAVIRAGEEHGDQYVFTATDGGYAKRTPVDQYRITGRNGLGVRAMKLVDERGVLVGAVVVREGDEVIAIRASGQVTRSAVTDVPAKSRDTMGVKFVDMAAGDQVLAIARNDERDVGDVVDVEEVDANGAPAAGSDVDPGADAGVGMDTGMDTGTDTGVDAEADAGVATDGGAAADPGTVSGPQAAESHEDGVENGEDGEEPE
jgi:DNA gyrase subunit A